MNVSDKGIEILKNHSGVELPLVEPVYSTYHYQGAGSAVIAGNPSIRNWYLNQVMELTCNRMFLKGRTTPDITIVDSNMDVNPYLERRGYSMQFLEEQIHPLIRRLIDAGYYVSFSDIDDYYVEGKTWYKERHFRHDGVICGYNQENKTYCIYAYDSNWKYQKFWTPQKSFEAGRKSMFEQGIYGCICGMRPMSGKVEFVPETALKKIAEYLDSSMEKYPEDEEGDVFGIIVHNYIEKYVEKLFDGSIPYERMDRRVFRLIWEHKKIMLERIRCIEKALGLASDTSIRYAPLVQEAETMKMLYASHHMKRRDSVLPMIGKKLLALKEQEDVVLRKLLKKQKE